MEQITGGSRWVYGSFSEQEMAYFSSVGPVPAREVANHMNPAPSTLFTRRQWHRWENCWD